MEKENISIGLPPGGLIPGTSFGVSAAQALIEGKIDGFWANGMGTEVAVRGGAGTVVLDVRRGDGPKGCFDYTMASIATTERLIEGSPETVAAVIRAIVRTQKVLKADVSLATKVGDALFPPQEAALIAELIRRDLPYYDVAISERSVAGMNDFACGVGILETDVSYDQVVATEFSEFWQS